MFCPPEGFLKIGCQADFANKHRIKIKKIKKIILKLIIIPYQGILSKNSNSGDHSEAIDRKHSLENVRERGKVDWKKYLSRGGITMPRYYHYTKFWKCHKKSFFFILDIIFCFLLKWHDGLCLSQNSIQNDLQGVYLKSPKVKCWKNKTGNKCRTILCTKWCLLALIALIFEFFRLFRKISRGDRVLPVRPYIKNVVFETGTEWRDARQWIACHWMVCCLHSFPGFFKLSHKNFSSRKFQKSTWSANQMHSYGNNLFFQVHFT